MTARLRDLLDPRLVVGGMPGGADDVHLAGGERRERERRLRHGEVDDAVGLGDQRRGVGRERDAVVAEPGQLPGVLADQRRARAFERARQRQARRLGNRLDQRAPHAPAGAGHDKPHVGHRSAPEIVVRIYTACGRAVLDELRARTVEPFDDDQVDLALAFAHAPPPDIPANDSRRAPPRSSEIPSPRCASASGPSITSWRPPRTRNRPPNLPNGIGVRRRDTACSLPRSVTSTWRDPVALAARRAQAAFRSARGCGPS